MGTTLRFAGRIAGWGTASGTRFVVGRWDVSPYGSFADVMLERPSGERSLLAPSEEIARLVASTYQFDRVEVVPVVVADAPPGGHRWRISAGPLVAELTIGGRTTLGRLLRLVPPRVATSVSATRVTDPVARLLLQGVRTRGSAGSGRREYYGATDVHRLDAVRTSWAGEDLGPMGAVDPPVRFGFGSTPAAPAVTDVVTTIVLADSARGDVWG
ncbi:hypothetical protein KV097_03760 [Mumia sp. zg.B17]|uniref:hypothetical protein n=1 Tax=unclassified Mumia TaxID=2621872 RepID=UPI001C6DE44A|nr:MULTISPECIES: hypothetical protein [unclassified Mumia]MBW9205047.1 hypothetical protein [Mumia sp. zg.B17]MBW9208949.1 hypothetical protein [Mumia sp. zg.B21]MDD9349629.1 hypothetical protein [Mumia sp.]